MFSALRITLDYRVVSTEFRVCQQGDQDTLACLGAGLGLSGAVAAQGPRPRDPGPGLAVPVLPPTGARSSDSNATSHLRASQVPRAPWKIVHQPPFPPTHFRIKLEICRKVCIELFTKLSTSTSCTYYIVTTSSTPAL